MQVFIIQEVRGPLQRGNARFWAIVRCSRSTRAASEVVDECARVEMRSHTSCALQKSESRNPRKIKKGETSELLALSHTIDLVLLEAGIPTDSDMYLRPECVETSIKIKKKIYEGIRWSIY